MRTRSLQTQFTNANEFGHKRIENVEKHWQRCCLQSRLLLDCYHTAALVTRKALLMNYRGRRLVLVAEEEEEK